jgi:hypothetical protein
MENASGNSICRKIQSGNDSIMRRILSKAENGHAGIVSFFSINPAIVSSVFGLRTARIRRTAGKFYLPLTR